MANTVWNESETSRSTGAGTQTFWRRLPSPGLRPFITAFMARRDFDSRDGMIIFPNAQPEIFAHFGSPYWTTRSVESPLISLPAMSCLVPRTGPYRHVNGPKVDWFLMQLTPLGCMTLLGAPMSELNCADLALSSLIGAAADDLFDALASTEEFSERCDIAEAWVSRHALVANVQRVAVSKFVTLARNRPIPSVKQAALGLGMSDRRLRQLFAAEIGMSPKSFLSLMRAERLWTHAHPNSGCVNWLDEFADQSHAGREFKRFTGMTVGSYLLSKRDGDALVNGMTMTAVKSWRTL